ncbi:MAG: TIGR00730 family Rossman fold protein [Syntrophobacteraceae bacterium]
MRLHNPKGQSTEGQYVIDALTIQDSWRLFKILAELVDGFEALSDLYPAVSIFGSARVRPGDETYEKTVVIARKLARYGYHIITGGGPGIMEAGNKGAREGGAESVGLNIVLPLEQEPNPYSNVRLDFQYFFVRKVMFVKYAQAYIGMPGGFGTLDEIFEALTLIQTKRIKPFPVILVGKSHWEGLLDWIHESLVAKEYISPDDLELLTILDDPDEVVQTIRKYVIV